MGTTLTAGKSCASAAASGSRALLVDVGNGQARCAVAGKVEGGGLADACGKAGVMS